MSNVLAETNDSGAVQNYYVHGLGLISRINNSGQRFTHHYDTIGNTVAVTDDSNTVVETYSYDDFGRVLASTGGSTNPFTFVGKYSVMDEGNGIFHMRARYYDTDTGRFISRDPLGFDGGDLNLYSYVGGNPTTGVDPKGLTGKKENTKKKVVKAAVNEAAVQITEKSIHKLGAKALSTGTHATGVALVKSSVYVPIVSTFAFAAYDNWVGHSERDWSDNLARTCIDITAGAVIGIGTLATAGGGTAASVLYSVQNEDIQNSIMHNSIVDTIGGAIYDIFWAKPAQ
jgi:RHS repeat-associated protein